MKKSITASTLEFVELSARADILHILNRAIAAVMAIPFCIICKMFCTVWHFWCRPTSSIIADIFRGFAVGFFVAVFLVTILQCMIF